MRYFAISLCVLVLGCAFFLDNCAHTVNYDSKFHIVLDAGHGGLDNGACVAGVSEANLNLQIVKVLEKELLARDFAVSLTRVDSESLNSPYAPNKKVEDMAKRREKIRQLAPDLVISIHQNTYPLVSVSGLQCFYANETAGSREYAAAIQAQFNEKSGLPMHKTIKATDFNLVEHSPCPAVLIECGFLTNPTERQLLQTAAYQQVLAFNICEAIVRMISQGGNKRCANVQPSATCSAASLTASLAVNHVAANASPNRAANTAANTKKNTAKSVLNVSAANAMTNTRKMTNLVKKNTMTLAAAALVA